MSIYIALLISLLFHYAINIWSNAVIGLYDAENWYDCVAHKFASLTDQYFDLLLLAIILCLKEVQEMKFYLRTVFGDSKGS